MNETDRSKQVNLLLLGDLPGTDFVPFSGTWGLLGEYDSFSLSLTWFSTLFWGELLFFGSYYFLEWEVVDWHGLKSSCGDSMSFAHVFQSSFFWLRVVDFSSNRMGHQLRDVPESFIEVDTSIISQSKWRRIECLFGGQRGALFFLMKNDHTVIVLLGVLGGQARLFDWMDDVIERKQSHIGFWVYCGVWLMQITWIRGEAVLQGQQDGVLLALSHLFFDSVELVHPWELLKRTLNDINALLACDVNLTKVVFAQN